MGVPDIIILDINLGECTGTILCEEIKKIKSYTHIPVIQYSANQYEQDIHTSCHAESFIEKPFSNTSLLETVKSLVAG